MKYNYLFIALLLTTLSGPSMSEAQVWRGGTAGNACYKSTVGPATLPDPCNKSQKHCAACAKKPHPAQSQQKLFKTPMKATKK